MRRVQKRYPGAAIIFYLLFIAGLLVFVVMPGLLAASNEMVLRIQALNN
jgi:uncharacterized membrane protein